MAGVLEEKEIGSLHHAAELLVSHGRKPVRVVVVRVQLRQAPALLQVLNTQVQKSAGWKLPHDQKLRHLARLSCEADVLLDVVLPLLKVDPKSAVGERLLGRYAWSVRRLGQKVDGDHGDFFTVCRKDGNALRRHINHIHDDSKTLAWLADNVTKLERSVLELKDTVVDIPRVLIGDKEEESSDEEKDDEYLGSDDDAHE